MDRIDVILFERELVNSREKAKVLIKHGQVLLNNEICTKPSKLVNETDKLEIINKLKFVGRGGYKLQKALEDFGINLQDKVCLDVGASTGGFTDCMLQYGAKKIFALDVGHSQLDETLKGNKKVISMEKLNIREVDNEIFDSEIDFITVDVSFMSVNLILFKLSELINKNGEIVILLKPQFEAGKVNIKKKGLVKSKKIHLLVLKNIVESTKEHNLFIKGLINSPIKGGEGNIEYLLYLSKSEESQIIVDIKDVVEKAFKEENYKNVY